MSDDHPKTKAELRFAPTSKGAPSDPLAFVRPGDDPKLDAMIAELRADSIDGDPLNPDWKKVRARRRAASEAARRRAAKKGVSPRWVRALMFTIAAPVVAMMIGLLYRRWPARPENGSEPLASAKAEAAVVTATATSPDADADAGADAAAGMSADAATTASGARPERPSHGIAPRPTAGTKAGARDEDPYESHTAVTAKPSVTVAPAAPTAAPSAPPASSGTDIW